MLVELGTAIRTADSATGGSTTWPMANRQKRQNRSIWLGTPSAAEVHRLNRRFQLPGDLYELLISWLIS